MAKAPIIAISGDRRVLAKLKRLPRKVQGKVLRRAMRDGMKIVQARVKVEAPVDKGVLRRNVKVRALKRKRGRIGIEVRVKPGPETKKISVSRKGKRKSVFYPAVVQFGRKGVPPDPFMTRAFSSSGETARDRTMQSILDGINREVEAP